MKAGTGRKISILAATLLLSACGGGGGGSVSPPGSAVVTFTRWNADVAGKTIKVDGRGKQVAYTYDQAQQKIIDINTTQEAAASALFTFDGSSVLTRLAITSTAAGSPAAGFTGDTISNLLWAGVDQDFLIVGNAASAGKAVVSDPRSGVWNYQSFGVWETYTTATTGDYGAMSLGANSPATAIPGSATATFEGKVVGSYVNAAGEGHTALADLTVFADFGTRSLEFSTLNTTISANDGGSITPRGDLNVTGILNIADPANSFSGNLDTAGSGNGPVLSGVSTGQFYGPNAEELGGVFLLRDPTNINSVETYSGAYGASLVPVP